MKSTYTYTTKSVIFNSLKMLYWKSLLVQNGNHANGTRVCYFLITLYLPTIFFIENLIFDSLTF